LPAPGHYLVSLRTACPRPHEDLDRPRSRAESTSRRPEPASEVRSPATLFPPPCTTRFRCSDDPAMASRLANLHAHLAPGATDPSAASPQPAAGVLKWLSGLFGGNDEEDGLEITPVATRESHPGQTWGHAHPDIVQTAVRSSPPPLPPPPTEVGWHDSTPPHPNPNPLACRTGRW